MPGVCCSFHCGLYHRIWAAMMLKTAVFHHAGISGVNRFWLTHGVPCVRR